MSAFDSALQAATALGSEYARLDAEISALGVAADHDPNYGADHEARFQAALARRSVLGRELTASFERFELYQREAWRTFLSESAKRLRALAESQDGERFVASGALYNWEPLSRGDSEIFDAPGGFGKGVVLLAQRRDAIDQLLSASR